MSIIGKGDSKMRFAKAFDGDNESKGISLAESNECLANAWMVWLVWPLINFKVLQKLLWSLGESDRKGVDSFT